MRREDVLKIFPLANSKVTLQKKKWIEGPCPWAPWRHDDGVDKHPSFGISYGEKHRSRMKCFSCNMRGDLMDMVMRLSQALRLDPTLRPKYKMDELLALCADEFTPTEFDSEIPDYGVMKPPEEFVLFPESYLASFKHAALFPVAKKYLLGRGIPYWLMTDCDIRFDPIQRRVCFPFRDFQGRLCGIQGRAIDDDNTLRYYQYGYQNKRNNTVWLGEHHLNLDKPIVTVEGPVDYAKVRLVYDNVCASFSCGIGWHRISRLADASEIITFYDYGKGGDTARHEIVKALKTPVTHLIPPDAETDAGAMDIQTLREYLGPHVKLKA